MQGIASVVMYILFGVGKKGTRLFIFFKIYKLIFGNIKENYRTRIFCNREIS